MEGIWNSGKRLIRSKLQSGDFPASFHLLTGDSLSVSWASESQAVFYLCSVSWAEGCLSLEHNGLDTISIACSPPGAQRWNCLWSIGVRAVHIFSS